MLAHKGQGHFLMRIEERRTNQAQGDDFAIRELGLGGPWNAAAWLHTAVDNIRPPEQTKL